MRAVNMPEAKTHPSRLVAAAAKGEPFVIACVGWPLAKAIAVEAAAQPPVRRTGFHAGRIRAPQDFDGAGAEVIRALFDGAP